MNNLEENSKPLDLSFLKQVSGDSPEFVLAMINLYNSQTLVLLLAVEKAIEKKDWDVIASTIHKIKPTFSYLGRDDIKENLKDIEQIALCKSDIQHLVNSFEKVQISIDILSAQLRDYEAKLRNS